MRGRTLAVAVAAAVSATFVIGLAPPAAAAVELMPGVTYDRIVKRVRGEQVVLHVVTAPRPGGLYELEPILSNGTVTGRDTVTAMQRRLASRATVVGINGDLYSVALGYPSGMFMRDGVLAARPTTARSSLGIGADGTLRVARAGFFANWSIGGSARRSLAQLNRPLARSGVGLFTPAWGAETPPAKNALDVVLSGLPATTLREDLAGAIVEIRNGGGTAIPAGGAVLQARGPARSQVRDLAAPGLSLVTRLNVKPWWADVENAIGGGPALVVDGKVALPTTEEFTSAQLLPRHPRTAVGQRANGQILFVTVDGRQNWSAGLSLLDLAQEMRNRGAVTAFAMDGGGGTTLAFEGRLLNTPSDGAERAVADALMLLYYGVYAARPEVSVLSPNGDGVEDEQRLAYKVVRPSTVEARLVGPDGVVFWSEQRARGAGTYEIFPDSRRLSEGRWRFVVSAVDENGDESSAERRFSVNSTLGFLELSKQHLRVKRKQGGRLGISFELARAARVRVTIENALGNRLRTVFARTRRESGSIRVAWNGKSGKGKVVKSGSYTIRVRTTNAIGIAELSDTVQVRRVGTRR